MKEKESKKKDISVNLNCYVIRFRKKGERSQDGKPNFVVLSDVFGTEKFKSISEKFIKFIDTNTSFVNEDKTRILYINELIDAKTTSISGIIRKGYGGQESYIDQLNKSQAKTVKTISVDEYNSMPFYFLLAEPDHSKKCLIFLAQSYKQFGFKEVFEEAFKKFFKEMYDTEYLCEFSTLSIASLFEKYINEGLIRKMRFRKHGLTKNIEDLFDDEKEDPEDYTMEISITGKRGFTKVKNQLKSDSPFLEIFKIKDFDYDEAFADVSFAGRKRVLNMSNPDEFSASFDITNEAKLNPKTNHPDFSSVDKEAYSILRKEIIPNIKS